jgi:beta-lactamase regulating signal transducer with metallopeptidase domain
MHAYATLADALLARLAWTSAQAAVLIAALWLVMRWMPRLSPAVRCMLWWLVGMQLVLGMMVQTPLQLHWLKPVAATPVMLDVHAHTHLYIYPGVTPVPVTPHVAAVATAQAGSWPWPQALLLAWAGIVLLQLCMALRQALEARALVRHAMPVTDAAILAICAQQSRALGVRRMPALRVSQATVSPQVSGLWRPVILLPAERTLSAEELAMALAHELAHVRRGDLWLGWIPAIAQRLFFFHPAVHWAMREYAVYREAACDAQVLQHQCAAPRSYGHLLVRLGVVDPVHASLAGASSTFDNLKRRLIMLQQNPSTPRLRSWLLVAAVAVIGVAPYRVTARQAGQEAAPTSVPPAGGELAHVPPAPPPRGEIAPVPPAPPPVPPDAPLPPPPPPPPAPPALREPGFHGHHVDIDTTPQAQRGFVLLDGDTVIVDGSDADLAQARRLAKTQGPVLWLRQEGKSYVVHDPAVIRQAKAIYAQSAQLAQAQGELAGKQGELAGQQAGLAARESALASRQADTAARRAAIQMQQQVLQAARTSPDNSSQEANLLGELRGIDAEQAQIQRQSSEIDQAAAKLSKQEAELSQRELAMSKQQQLDSQLMNKRLDEVLREAIAKGLAQPLPR